MHDKRVAATRVVGVVVLLAAGTLLLGASLAESTGPSRSLSRSYRSEVHDTFDYTVASGLQRAVPFGPASYPHAWILTPAGESDPGLHVEVQGGELRIQGITSGQCARGYTTGMNGLATFALDGDVEVVYVVTLYRPGLVLWATVRSAERDAGFWGSCDDESCYAFWRCDCLVSKRQNVGTPVVFPQPQFPKTYVIRMTYSHGSRQMVVQANSKLVGVGRLAEPAVAGPFLVRFVVSSSAEAGAEIDCRLEEIHVGWDGTNMP